VAELTYREAVAAGIAQEMERDPTVYFIGEDVAEAGGVFKATVGLLERFGPDRVRDTPISEEAIVGAAMGAAMTGLRPIAEIMFSDFLATCWDIVANQIAKTRYMTNGQVSLPLVIRTANGAGSRFGAQHSQSVENWAMSVPGLKVVAPSSPADVKGLIASAVRDPDPVIVFEHKSLYPTKGEVPDGEHVVPLGEARVVRIGSDLTIVGLAAMVPKALEAAERLATLGIWFPWIPGRSSSPSGRRVACSPWRRTRDCAGGARKWWQSRRKSVSTTSTGPSSASPPRTSRCRQLTRWKTRRCRPSIGSRTPSGGASASGAIACTDWGLLRLG